MRKAVLSLLLWTWTGTTYFFAEVVFKTLCGRPETISWTMLALAILLAIPLERFGAELPWDCPLWLQALICGTAIVAAELAAGLYGLAWQSGITPPCPATSGDRSARSSGPSGACCPCP